MGAWNFYLEIEADATVLLETIQKLEKSPVCLSCFRFCFAAEEKKLTLEGMIDDFMPASFAIFELLRKTVSEDVILIANGVERKWDFKNKGEFLFFMYGAWEEKIDFAYSTLGTVVLGPENYSRKRKKLYRKYYKKIP